MTLNVTHRDETEGAVVVAHSNYSNRHEQSSPDHYRLNIGEHQVLILLCSY